MIPQLPKVSGDMKPEELANLVAILIKEVTWLLNGHITANNVQANSMTTKTLKAGAVTAEKISVNELSAISANLGTIIAGEIYGILIQGSQIQTSAPGSYPRVELSSSQNLIRAEGSQNNRVEVNALGTSGIPVIYLQNGVNNILGAIQATSALFMIGSALGDLHISAVFNIWISANRVRFNNWNSVYNDATNRTLQDELNALSARITALGG